MAKRNREYLKSSFKQGCKPKEEDFEHLIDSTMNILDDGISKTSDNGWMLSPHADNDTVLSVSQRQELLHPLWKIALEKENNNLEIRYCGDESEIPVCRLKPDGSVVWGNEDEVTLRNGVIRAKFREGTLYEDKVAADGKWHDITPELADMQALEVTAFAGEAGDRKQSVLIAVATCCSGRHARIVQTLSHAGCFLRTIRLRWKRNRKTRKAKLQVRTGWKYGRDKQIRYQITGLIRSDDNTTE